jgi:tetratricopeptide (TPR) repeat protein
MNSFAFQFLLLAVALLASPLRAADTNGVPSGRTDETNSQETLRSFLQLQEQIHGAQLAIEQNRLDAKEAAEATARALALRLRAIEEAVATQRAQELRAMQSSNQVMIIVAGVFAAIGFVAMLLMAYFQWRTVHRLAELSAALPPRGFEPLPALPALGSGEAPLVALGPAEQSSVRLVGALERLEQRILQLEHTAGPAVKNDPTGPAGSDATNGHGSAGTARVTTPSDSAAAKTNWEPSSGSNGEPTPASEAPHTEVLLAKGQSLLNLDQAEAALACFDEILELEPAHPEALVKKGAALERLQRPNEALEYYDKAIAADDSMTVAYLHKGGLFNRLERFSEALACYEQALRTQESRR